MFSYVKRNVAGSSAWCNVILGSSSQVLSDRCKFILCGCCPSLQYAAQHYLHSTCLQLENWISFKLLTCLVSTKGGNRPPNPAKQEISEQTNLGNSWGKCSNSFFFFFPEKCFQERMGDTGSSFRSNLKWIMLCNVFRLCQSHFGIPAGISSPILPWFLWHCALFHTQ